MKPWSPVTQFVPFAAAAAITLLIRRQWTHRARNTSTTFIRVLTNAVVWRSTGVGVDRVQPTSDELMNICAASCRTWQCIQLCIWSLQLWESTILTTVSRSLLPDTYTPFSYSGLSSGVTPAWFRSFVRSLWAGVQPILDPSAETIIAVQCACPVEKGNW